MKLRGYQSDAIMRVLDAWDNGNDAPCVVLPTGSGKTVIFSEIVNRLTYGTRDRVLILAHRDELISQTVHKLTAMNVPGRIIGIVKASTNDCHKQVIVASIQTLFSEVRRNQIGKIDYVIVDECHHYASAKYREALTSFTGAKRVGFTATMSRSDKKDLSEIWESIVYSRSIQTMIRDGFLVKPEGKMINVADLELKSNGSRDYTDKAISRALRESSAVEATVKAWHEHALDRPTILFAPDVTTACSFNEGFTSAGITSATITGNTPTEQRKAVYRAFETGRTKVLCSCMVLTEGFDAPWADTAIIARPTKSNALYVQMVGRVLRTFPGKTSALVLDMAGASDGMTLSLPAVIPTTDPTVPGAPRTPTEGGQGTGDDVLPADIGGTEIVRVDLIADSYLRWQRTMQGTMFLATGNTFVFVLPLGNGYSVGETHSQDAMWGRIGGVDVPPAMHASDVPLDFAVSVAEDLVMSRDARFLAGKTSAWRKRQPSEKQARYARFIGVNVSNGMTSGDLSDAINVVKASKVIDPK